MASSPPSLPHPGYWYESLDGDQVAVLNLLRDYRDAERTMRAQTREDMRMNETELLALRFLMSQRKEGKEVLQRDMAKHLGITGASASALAQRLERDGYIQRSPHPTDGRATLLILTQKADGEVRQTLTSMHQHMLDAVQQLDATELAAVRKFLNAMIVAVQ